MPAVAHHLADIMQQGRRLENSPLFRVRLQLLGQLIVKLEGEQANVDRRRPYETEQTETS